MATRSGLARPTRSSQRHRVRVREPSERPVGQLTLAALVPTLRRLGTDLPKAAARQFNRVAWPAFGVLIVTGVWNVVAERDKVTGEYRTTLVVKIVVVAVSGATAALHARSRSRTGLAVFGALTGISALT